MSAAVVGRGYTGTPVSLHNLEDIHMFRSNRRAASLVPLLAASAVLVASAVLLIMSSSDSSTSKEDLLAQVANEPAGDAPTTEQAVLTPPPIAEEPTTPIEQPGTVKLTPVGAPGSGPRTSSGHGLDDSDTLPYSNAKETKPPLQFEMPFLDMGILRPGDFVTNLIEVENTSDERLTVRNIYTGCKCTVAYFEDNQTIIGPGERLNLVIETEAGYNLISKSVSVSVAVREYKSALRFTTKFQVNHIVACSPKFLNAKRKKNGQLTLRASDGRPFRVLSINGDAPVYHENQEFNPDTDPARTLYTIKWDLNTVEKMPRLLIVETDHPENRIIGLPIYSIEQEREARESERGNLVGLQKTINLGYIKLGESREITVEFNNVRPTDRKRGIFYGPEGIEAEHIKSVRGENTTSYETFRITLNDKMPLGAFQRAMTFEVASFATRIWYYGVATDGQQAN